MSTLASTWWISPSDQRYPAPLPMRIPFAPSILKVRREYPPLPPRFYVQPYHINAFVYRGMPWSNNRLGDGLRVYLTGAASDGAAQDDVDLSLGNYRSSSEADRVGRFIASPVRGIQVLQASRTNGTDGVVGSLTVVDANRLKYTAPGSSTSGPTVTIGNGATKVLRDGDNASKWVRVTRTSASDLAGAGVIEYVDQLNNVFSLIDAANTESTGGGDRYRAVILRNDDIIGITAIKIFVPVLALGSTAVSSVGQLSGAGAGTITGAANAFCGWPSRGWARIEQSGGTLREIVYYSSRTDTALTVPSLGRGRLGTSATAGGATDNCYPVPGIRISHEAASPLTGPIQTIADESTAPTGVSWSTARTAATGVSVGTLYVNQHAGIWIHRELPAGIDATAKAWSQVGVEYVSNGVTYTETLAGLYRIAVDARARYELHIGAGSEPDITAAATETFTSLPHTTSYTFAAGNTYYMVTNSRNKFDLVSQYDQTTVLAIDGSGDETGEAPSTPEIFYWEPAAGGTFVLKSTYAHHQDAEAIKAEEWLIYTTYNGATPTPGVDTPTVVSLTNNDVVTYLEWTSPAQSNGVTGKVLVRVRRDSTSSASSAVFTAVAETAGPSTPDSGTFYRRVAES